MTRVLVVRHGQSEWNAAGRWQGRADPPLTELGFKQARAAAASLPRFDHLAASTLARARQTAETIAETLECPEPSLHDGLVERDLGVLSGLTRAEIDTQFPGAIDNGDWPQGWEPTEQLLERVQDVFAKLSTAHSTGTVIAVAHGGVIYALESLFGIEIGRIANLGGRWFEATSSGLELGERVHLLDPADETVPDQL